MGPGAPGHGWPEAQGREAAAGASGAERRRRPWMAGDGAQRSAGHGWPKKQTRHGWRGHLSRGAFRTENGQATRRAVQRSGQLHRDRPLRACVAADLHDSGEWPAR